MAIEISSDTIVKILVRRGTDSERKNTILTEGEVGYCVDTQRLFVGDGITRGGIPTSTKFLGLPGNKAAFNSLAQTGDLIYQTTDNTLYSYSPGTIPGDPWYDVHPKVYTNNLEKTSTGRWRIAKEFSGDSTLPYSGFTILYPDSPGNTFNSITKQYNRLDFDSRFLSLCAIEGINPGDPNRSSFYIGDVNQSLANNKLDASLNVENSIFLNTHSSSLRQLKLYARNPVKTNSSLIESISGGFDIRGDESINFFVQNREAIKIQKFSGANTTFNILFSSAPNTGSFGFPNFDFAGKTRFRDDVFFDVDADVTINGNLSVLGETTYLDTIVTVTSALSVINKDLRSPALFVGQFLTTDSNNQSIVTFTDDILIDGIRRPAFQAKERQYVAFNAPETFNRDTGEPAYSFVSFGDTVFRTHPITTQQPGPVWGTGRFGIDMSNQVSISGAQGIRLNSASADVRINALTNIANTAGVQFSISAQTNSLQATAGNNVITASNLNQISGNTTLNGYFQATSNSGGNHSLETSTGNITLNCPLGVFSINGTNFDVDAVGNVVTMGKVHIESETDADGAQGTGSLTTDGGAYIHKNLYVKQDIIAFTSSDKRLKDNITVIQSPLEKLKKLSGVLFDWNEKSGYTGRDYGVIAQEVEEIMPEIVVTRDNGYKAVKYEKIIPLLIEAIKELNINK